MIPLVLNELVPYSDIDVFVPIQEYFLQRLTGVVQEAGFNIASMIHSKRLKTNFLPTSNTCVDAFNSVKVPRDPCAVNPTEVLFLRWSGESWGAKGYICGKGIAMSETKREEVITLTSALFSTPVGPSSAPESAPSAWQPILPEAPTGWVLYEEYNKELALSLRILDKDAYTSSADADNSKVCFAVEVSSAQISSVTQSTKKPLLYQATYVQDLIRSLQIQTDGNWKAFLYAKTNQLTSQLRDAAEAAKDSRVSFISALHKNGALLEIAQKAECKWLSATEGNNIYGSEVVERIHRTPPLPETNAKPDMLLVPLDSALYADQDSRRRGESLWNHRCVGIETTIALYQFSYTVQPVPAAGQVYAASIFLDRLRLIKDKVLTSVMSMKPKEVMCAKCEDGEVAQRLVRELGWSYSRLALDGLRTVVFAGPSPTYCIASGNVWLDHPCMGESRMLDT
eukprot:CAMPEP_0170410474 /NCGR_PEP_ID=MMETSP0117_2-20130122/29905_1 /TAXON_ID=400756 /ORGANISM="Durinskia baltica, Strain CSIRO CS-38" /LENGTH=453 /DNA_ID=CAMNT_0010668001 /DNA_START=102 /DNA_END=1463 /DNA_ORIENTATION=-